MPTCHWGCAAHENGGCLDLVLIVIGRRSWTFVCLYLCEVIGPVGQRSCYVFDHFGVTVEVSTFYCVQFANELANLRDRTPKLLTTTGGLIGERGRNKRKIRLKKFHTKSV